ncbi:MAG: CBU_0585 family protein [Candidatus Comchoanobacterales bacterium]
MKNRIFVTLKKNITSLADRVLQKARQDIPPTQSQLNELNKHQNIFKLRDKKKK